MKNITQSWSQLETPQKIAYFFGYGVMLTGLAHLILYLLSPEAVLEGPIGFRKPMVFGLSAGFTLVTMGWLLKFYKSRPRLHTIMMSMMSAALVIEIIIIDLQRYRGLPSHFNMGTPLDTALWSIMGLSILIFASVSTTQAILSFGKLSGSPSMNLAIRTSMILFFFSQISGQLIVSHGMEKVFVQGTFVLENIEHSTTVGEAGNLKLPHAISLHSIQALPLLGLLLMGVGVSEKTKNCFVISSAIGFAVITLFTQLHAYSGMSIWSLTTFQFTLLIISFIFFLAPYLISVVAILKQHCHCNHPQILAPGKS
jgi:hypothetical protein